MADAAVITFADQPDVPGTALLPRPFYDEATGTPDWPAGVEARFTGFGLTEEFGHGEADTKSAFGAADFGSGAAAVIAFSAPVKVPQFHVFNLNGESEPYDGSFRVEGRLGGDGGSPVFVIDYTDGFRTGFIPFDVATHPVLDRPIDKLSFFQFDSMNLDTISVVAVPEPVAATAVGAALPVLFRRRARAARGRKSSRSRSDD